jgi:hypothetical protein
MFLAYTLKGVRKIRETLDKDLGNVLFDAPTS